MNTIRVIDGEKSKKLIFEEILNTAISEENADAIRLKSYSFKKKKKELQAFEGSDEKT